MDTIVLHLWLFWRTEPRQRRHSTVAGNSEDRQGSSSVGQMLDGDKNLYKSCILFTEL